MSFKRFLPYFAFFVGSIISYAIGIRIWGIGFMWLPTIILALFIALMFWDTKRSTDRDTLDSVHIVPTSTRIPTHLQSLNDELQQLGFSLEVEARVKNLRRHRRGNNWLYLNDEKTVVVALVTFIWRSSSLTFTSYFPNNFVISTQYPSGTTIESDIAIAHVVNTSLLAAYDYHTHHMQQWIAQYGEPIKVTDWQQILDIELQTQLPELNAKVGYAVVLRLMLMLVFIAAMLGVFEFWIPTLSASLGLLLVVAIALAFCGLIIVIGYPLFADSVEARKKKKRKNT